MEGEDLRTWKNRLSEQHLGLVSDGLCIKNEPLARMQCQLASVVQDPSAQIHGHPSWDPSEIKREPGMGIDCQGHQGHGSFGEHSVPFVLLMKMRQKRGCKIWNCFFNIKQII